MYRQCQNWSLHVVLVLGVAVLSTATSATRGAEFPEERVSALKRIFAIYEEWQLYQRMKYKPAIPDILRPMPGPLPDPVLKRALSDSSGQPGPEVLAAARQICLANIAYLKHIEGLDQREVSASTLVPLKIMLRGEWSSQLSAIQEKRSEGQPRTLSRREQAKFAELQKQLERWKYRRRVHVDPAERKELAREARKACEDCLAVVAEYEREAGRSKSDSKRAKRN